MTEIPNDPYVLFEEWFREAEATEPDYPSAMSLATIDTDGRPSVRIVLMRKHGPAGFEFFTNYESRKGTGLIMHPDAELCFYWKSTQKQVRISGRVEKTSADESDEYFAGRPRGSRVGAWASQQTRVLESFEDLSARVAEAETRFDGQETIPRPPYWGGFRVVPDRIEFWEEQPFRLHKRFRYVKDGAGWKKEWLFP
jgi:pyridoxamine 5'-phosphate oxidase